MLKIDCFDLHIHLSENGKIVINEHELYEELMVFKNLVSAEYPRQLENPFSFFSFINEHSLIDSFPNLSIALRIYLTLSHIASEERSCSPLTIIIKKKFTLYYVSG